MPNNFYDVHKMLREDMEGLVTASETLSTQWSSEQNVDMKRIAESTSKLENNEQWLESIGVDIESIRNKAKTIGSAQAESIISDNEKKISEFDFSTPKALLSYDDIVSRALERGYVNTTVNDLLTDADIINADARLQAIEQAFAQKTKLNKVDIAFLTTAVALQVIRQYVVDPWLKDQRSLAGGHDESAKGSRTPGWYRVETSDILINAVPFDTGKYGDHDTIQGFLKGHKNHRESTLGHDPFFGYIFGTMNIMTGTITNYRFQTAHVKYSVGQGNVIHSMASTSKMASVTIDRVFNEGLDGKLALAFSLIRESIHLASDINTKHGIPLPLVNSLTPEFGESLCKYGIDTASVGTEASLSALINMIIAMVHRLIKKESDKDDLYEVRTRRILLYSNVIASSSNVIAVSLGTAAGVVSENPKVIEESLKKLDIGGLIVTISRLFSDIRFISKIKEEFIQKELDKPIVAEIKHLDSLLVSD